MNNNSKIISYIFLSISLLLLFYIFYKAQIVHGGLESVYYLKYYYFSFSLIILSLFSFKLSKEIKFMISTVIIASTFSLYIAEIVLLKINNYEDTAIKKFALKKNPNFDLRSQYEAYMDFKRIDENYVNPVLPKHFIYDYNVKLYPLSGIPNKPVVSCNENGYFATYNNDRFGFNNPDNQWDFKTIDYVLLGDSATHGDCVNEPDTIGGKMRSYDNVNSLLNLAQAGNDQLIEYATLKEYMPIGKIKNVLILYHENNDLPGLSLSLKHPILKKYFDDENFSQKLKNKVTELKKIKEESMSKRTERGKKQQDDLDWIKANKKIYERRKLITQIRNTIVFTRIRTELIEGNRFEKAEEDVFKEFEEILMKYKKFLKAKDINFYFVYLPDIRRYVDNEKNNNDDLRHYGKVKDVIKKLNINFIDINEEVFKDYPNPFELFAYGKFGGHFNEKGYEETAKAIYNKTRN
jgi:hypothetical protein